MSENLILSCKVCHFQLGKPCNLILSISWNVYHKDLATPSNLIFSAIFRKFRIWNVKEGGIKECQMTQDNFEIMIKEGSYFSSDKNTHDRNERNDLQHYVAIK